MTELFDFMGNKVRVVVMPNGEPRFVVKDVCFILDLYIQTKGKYRAVNVAMLKPRVGAEHFSLNTVEGKVRDRKGVTVSEAGLYKMVMKSRKPQAKAFQDWIARDVLPAIRKDGLYVRGEEKVLTGEMSLEEMTLKVITGMQDKGVV